MDKKLKPLWIKALEETIAKHKIHIVNKTIPFADADECPLCIFEATIQDSTGCNKCIHKTGYSQRTHCSNQKSLRNMMMFPNINPTTTPFNKRAINYRIHILNNIIKRLKT